MTHTTAATWARGRKALPAYTRQNSESAAIILADPARHLAWPVAMSEAEIEASLMVRWARKISQSEEPKA